MKKIQQKAKNMLTELGVPQHLKGYQYLTEAITEAAGAEEVLNVKVKDLYRQIAKLYGTTVSFVEKAIQQAICATWNLGDRESLSMFFGYSNDTERPTNSEFIIFLADKVQLEMLCENAKD